MPQVKGQAVWDTNLNSTGAEDDAQIDESNVKIENMKIDKRLRIRFGEIQMMKMRSLADIDFYMKDIKKEAEQLLKMKRIIEQNHVERAIESRRRALTSLDHVDMMALKIVADDNSPRSTENDGLNTSNPQSKVRFDGAIEESSDYDKDKNVYANNEINASSGRVSAPPNISNRRQSIMATPISERRPSTVFYSDDRRQSTAPSNTQVRPKTAANSQRGDNTNSGRPKTAMSMMSGGGRPSRARSRTRMTSGARSRRELGTSETEPSTPGRSFQELKGLTNVDKLSQNDPSNARSRMMRQRRIEDDRKHGELQNKIKQFYQDIKVYKLGYCVSKLEKLCTENEENPNDSNE
ncbi:unnamed protein product [Owenia fusiformis]|uniref:Uncharacterized protein n=1 Tax=Owenia fusiformis TaxID=6347 RepID=A0A8J1TEM3_OWEFU|nr:unnamed protein product [Owenia fusiformis]